LWLWGHDAGAHNDDWGLPGPSRITPAEAAFYLGIPNLIMVRYKGRPPLPLDQYAVSLRALRQVVWSAVGAHGQTDEAERTHILDLAARHSNISGIMLDDFFVDKPGEEPAALSLDQLGELRGRLRGMPTPAASQPCLAATPGGVGMAPRLDLWAVLYEHQLDDRLVPFLDLLDMVSLWAWDAEKVRGISDFLGRLETLAPSCGRALGCYMWDYGRKRPMPLDLLKEQYASGLSWLRQGRIEGMIFLASCICDLALETVEWTRRWVAKIGDERLQAGGQIH
jgi:hypothetical protein